jgi:hypothetical protein
MLRDQGKCDVNGREFRGLRRIGAGFSPRIMTQREFA